MPNYCNELLLKQSKPFGVWELERRRREKGDGTGSRLLEVGLR